MQRRRSNADVQTQTRFSLSTETHITRGVSAIHLCKECQNQSVPNFRFLILKRSIYPHLFYYVLTFIQPGSPIEIKKALLQKSPGQEVTK